MKHKMFIKNTEVDCCDENLFETFKENAKYIKIRIESFSVYDIEFLDFTSNGDYSLVFKRHMFFSSQSFESKLCVQCVNRILWFKLNQLSIQVNELREDITAIENSKISNS